MENVKELIDLASALSVPVGALALMLYSWRKTGHIDLIKALEHARDVVHVVAARVEKDGNEDAAVEDAVNEVSKLRGKRMSKKVRRKLAARIRSLHRDAE